jgi:predicted amidohydrolase YtcJ
VLLAHDSGHACVVSTPVLELLPAEVPHSDGLLTENTAAAARALRRPYSLDELADAIADAAGECLRQGVTVCAEAGVGGGLIADDRLALGALKIFTDGGMMPRTAALSAPYAGLDHARQLYDDPAELTRQIVEGHRAGWQLAILPQALGAWEVPPSSATGPWTSSSTPSTPSTRSTRQARARAPRLPDTASSTPGWSGPTSSRAWPPPG